MNRPRQSRRIAGALCVQNIEHDSSQTLCPPQRNLLIRNEKVYAITRALSRPIRLILQNTMFHCFSLRFKAFHFSFYDAFSLTATVSAFYVFNRYKWLICRFLACSYKYNPLILNALQIDLYRGLPTHFFDPLGSITPVILP